MNKSQVYTKTGDQGKTSLIGGTRVPKHHYRLEAYGTVDELNAQIGMLRSWELDEASTNMLIQIQEMLFTVGATLATDEQASDLKSKLKGDEREIEALELEMDRMDNALPPLRHFVLPGGNPAVAQCHIIRTICRRAERRVNQMATEVPVDPWLLKYLNRLSDYFFVISRHLAKYFNAEEIPWKPKL